MATADGFQPYSLGLTAIQVKDAINRAHNISTELANFNGFYNQVAMPLIADGIVEVDIWRNGATGKLFRAYIDTTNALVPELVYFEVC